MKLFQPSKWELWWDSLPEHTKQYIKNQPVWHDRDMFKALAIGFAIGLVIGLMV
jgi:ElaB/YqjD/DUF883 family membrane-anchored ribosome-binding protein